MKPYKHAASASWSSLAGAEAAASSVDHAGICRRFTVFRNPFVASLPSSLNAVTLRGEYPVRIWHAAEAMVDQDVS